MADTAVAITAGTGTNIDTRTEATNGNHRQVIVIGDPSTNAGVAPVDATKGLAVDLTASGALPTVTAVTTVATVTNLAQMGGAALNMGSGAISTGTQRIALASDSPGIITTGTIGDGNLSATVLTVDVKANATSIAKLEDAASADGDKGVPAMVVRKATPANSSGTDGDYEFLQASGGYLWTHDNKGLANLAFSAAFTTLTRPANTTAYTAADSISDNATAGSVTALTATIADVNDDPLFISEILVTSTDTGLAGKKLRAYLFNSDPTASSGVSGGDNAAYAQKKAGYVGSLMGFMETGFSDGTVGRLVPSFNETNLSQAGGFIVTKPTSGAKTLFIQYQAVEAFTPSANSTTIIGTARGWQARAV